MQISRLQIVEPKYWSNLTRESHLGWLGLTEPEMINNWVDRIYEVNYGADNIVSFIDKFPIHYVSQDGPYRWRIQGSDERNIPLVKASLTETGTAISATDTPGIGRSIFFMFFAERYFEATSVLVGERPNDYSLRVLEDPVQVGNNWRIKVQLITGDDELFLPYEELQVATRWSEEYGLVEQELSKRGNSVHHVAPYMMENTLSSIRKNYDVPGNMISQGKNKPLAFSFIDQDGKQHSRWIDKLGWDFMTQFRRDKARLLMYGKSNKLADGAYGNFGESGNVIKSGFGLNEQMEGGNILYYNDFDLDMLTDFAMGLSVGKLPEDSREFVLSTGEYGAYQFHKAASEKASGITYLQSDHNLAKLGVNKMQLEEGQFLNYLSVNGISFKIMIDPMKDDPVRNKMTHPSGGLASSYEYDIYDFGTTNGQSNIQRVAVEGEEEFFAYIPGMRNPFTPYNKNKEPKHASSSVDGYSVYKQFIGGIMLRNPFRTGRIIPNVLRPLFF